MKKEYIEPQVRFVTVETQEIMKVGSAGLSDGEAVGQLSKDDEEFGW